MGEFVIRKICHVIARVGTCGRTQFSTGAVENAMVNERDRPASEVAAPQAFMQTTVEVTFGIPERWHECRLEIASLGNETHVKPVAAIGVASIP
jgi:hypothetical protein